MEFHLFSWKGTFKDSMCLSRNNVLETFLGETNSSVSPVKSEKYQADIQKSEHINTNLFTWLDISIGMLENLI